jgi:hypothetical protein
MSDHATATRKRAEIKFLPFIRMHPLGILMQNRANRYPEIIHESYINY